MQLKDLKILLAEDNSTNRMVARQMLESMGATVLEAGDGAAALDALRRQVFDVLLIDIEMPRLSGLEVIRSLAATGAAAHPLTIIALTATSAPAQRDAVVAAGAAGVITKPIVSLEQFGRDIRELLHAPVRGPAADEQAQIDMSVYRSLAAAVGAEALEELLCKVDADISDAYDRMEKALSEGETMELRAATHILIAVAGAIGAIGLQGLAQRLNRAAQAGEGADIDGLGAAAMIEAGRVRAFLDRERAG